MKKEEIKTYASSLLAATINRAPNSTYAIPVGRLRAMCNLICEKKQEKLEKPPLTKAEQAVFAAIKTDIDTGHQPTLRSVQARLEYASINSVRVIVDRLIKHGYIKREGSKKQIVIVK